MGSHPSQEVQRLSSELKTALDREAALAAILQVISRSPTDAQPVFDIIAESAARLCEAQICAVFQFDGALVHLSASHGLAQEAIDAVSRAYPMAPGRGSAAARAVLSGTVEQIPDVDADNDYAVGAANRIAFRSTVAAPMLRDGIPIGAISVARTGPGYFPDQQIQLLQTFADQAVIAIQNVRLFDEVQARNRELSDSLEQQVATGAILRAIAASPTDIQPVLDAVAESAAQLCDAQDSNLMLRRADVLTVAVHYGTIPIDYTELPIVRDMVSGSAVLDRTPIHIHDMADAEGEFPASRAIARRLGVRTLLTTPLLQEGEAIGALMIRRTEVRPFSDKQIELLKTFADQAVIAIQNVRLFEEVQARTRDVEARSTELNEALQQQTATADVLKVISRSAFDLQTVLDTLVESAVRLCRADSGSLERLIDGVFRYAASYGFSPAFRESVEARPSRPGSGSAVGRAAIERSIVQIEDVRSDPQYDDAAIAEAGGFRTVLAIPLLREGGEVIGVFAMTRSDVRPFADKEIELVQTFADQAVIAIENVRLFDEVQARNRQVTEALEQKTATSDILRVISGSPTDVQPVFETIVRNAVVLCRGLFANVFRYDGELLHFVASHNVGPDYVELLKTKYPMRPDASQVSGRVILNRSVVRVEDALADPDYDQRFPRKMGWRRMLGVPMLRDAELLGVIITGWAEAGPVPTTQEELLKTFAEQAVIAIENVRLFDEVQARTADLTEALRQQTATADVLKVISRSTFDLPAVLDALVQSAAALCGANYGGIFLRDGDALRGRATISERPTDWGPDHSIAINRKWISGRVALSGRVEHIPDVLEDADYDLVQLRQISDTRALMGVPLLREGKVDGVFFLGRPEPGAFTPRQSELVQTFADQAGIAIENVRLFDQVQARTRELSNSLEDLRTAQDRLVQTEKLASLGQLTAGIAHEIKNPLNFVNNFSALSAELIDELREAMTGVMLNDKTRAEIEELTSTLASNLDKVVQHGKRADSIVKNMLLHSRAGSGEHRPVDINAVVEESLNLAYHGARAEKQGFTITIEKALDPAAGEVDVFPQEITRALLNLISNGFYATTKRKVVTGDGYEPTLTAATRNLGDSVEVRIRDNGTGISAEVQEKIFNPFFTTKPAGEGTGLGLSLSHDIVVKQHAGSIEVETELGEFTEFRIVLPRGAAALGNAGGASA